MNFYFIIKHFKIIEKENQTIITYNEFPINKLIQHFEHKYCPQKFINREKYIILKIYISSTPLRLSSYIQNINS